MDDEDGEAVAIDRAFLTHVLGGVRDLGELKLILAVLGLASEQGKEFVAVEALRRPEAARMVCGEQSPEPLEVRLDRVLTRAVANGFVLRVAIARGDREEGYVLAATASNRARVEELLRTGAISGSSQGSAIEGISIVRPNTFTLYEQYIGPLTPMIAEQLRDAERSYPRAWLERAFELASEYNRQSWKYVEAILRDWERSGAPV